MTKPRFSRAILCPDRTPGLDKRGNDMINRFAIGVLGALALAPGAKAAVVTATYSGVMIFTEAEEFGFPWGYDAWGNYVVGAAYSATIVFNTSAGVTSYYPGPEQAQDQRPGFATDSFTVAGHTYNSTGSAISTYLRGPDFIQFNISDSPSDFEGVYFEAITNSGVTISPSLNVPLSLTSADFLPGDAGGNVVMYANGGGLYGNYDVETLNISVSAPEPSTWAMMFLGFAALGFVGYRRDKSARTAA
jgi:hypothetical protein